MEVSNTFVVIMGMGVTFVGLTCIIALTALMGKVMQLFGKPEPPKKTSGVAAPAPKPAAPADGLTEEIKIAIMAALAQEPGFRMESVQNVTIRRV